MIYEEIPMEEPYRQQLRKNYIGPLQRNIVVLVAFVLGVSALFIVPIFRNIGAGSLRMLLMWIPIICIAIYLKYFLFRLLVRHKLHYFKDYKFGFIIKEQMTITKVFHTPAGINIYWLDSDIIKTFTPNPYRHFYEGDQVIIYYLKYSKEYLDYEV